MVCRAFQCKKLAKIQSSESANVVLFVDAYVYWLSLKNSVGTRSLVNHAHPMELRSTYEKKCIWARKTDNILGTTLSHLPEHFYWIIRYGCLQWEITNMDDISFFGHKQCWQIQHLFNADESGFTSEYTRKPLYL